MSDTKMQLEDWLDDLCVRFIINLPQEDLSSVPRICFQVEEAQWFYEDFIRPLDPTLPSMSLRTFCLRIFQHCPLLTTFPVGVHIQAFEEFLQYKTRVPVRGAILLNEEMDSVLLVRGWKKGANWSFPRGKINKDEDDLDCAIREVYEETGFDIREAGLVASQKETKFIEVTMRDQQIRLYVFRDVPMDTRFQPRTRKEISKIQWYKLSELPAFRKKGHGNHSDGGNAATNANKFYMVAPFLVPLKKWIVQQQKKDASRARNEIYAIPEPVPEEAAVEDYTWTRPEAVQGGPDLDALEGATRELQRLLKMQPPTQGLQQQIPSQPSPDQDKGGALLALLQSKVSVPSSQTRAPHTPTDHVIANPEQPRSPHHHPAQHPPLANRDYPPPAFHITQTQGHWTPEQYPNSQLGNVPPMQPDQQVPGFLQPQPNEPTLVHPQPLPPHVQKTGVLNYTTPSPHTLVNGPPGPQGAPRGVPQQAPYLGYPVAQTRPPGGPLTGHSKALLDAFKQPASHNAQPTEIRNPPPYPTSDYESTRAPEVVYAASKPYQPAANPQMPTTMYPSYPGPQGVAVRNQGPVNEKHRSALLDMFKRTDPNTSPRAANFGRPASGSGSHSKPSSIVGASPRIPMANLSLHDQSGSPSSKPYHSPRSQGREQAAPRVSSSGSSQPLMQLLRRQEQASPKIHQRPTAAAASNYSYYYDPAQAVPAGLASPPAPTSLPVPVFQKQQVASPEHKQKLLSLFGQPQVVPPPVDESAPEPVNIIKRPSVEYHSGSITPGAGYVASTATTTVPAPDSRRGSGTPISPADRSFLLGYLQSATHQASH